MLEFFASRSEEDSCLCYFYEHQDRSFLILPLGDLFRLFSLPTTKDGNFSNINLKFVTKRRQHQFKEIVYVHFPSHPMFA